MATTQEQILIEQRVANDAKSVGVAYLLAIFLGGLGVHRFYLGRTGSAVAQLLLFILGWLTIALFIGIVPLLVVGVWIVVDLFLIPGMVQGQKNAMRQHLTQEMIIARGRAMETPVSSLSVG